jgi:hypothetical protein
MQRLGVTSWGLVGLAAAMLGWALGGLAGSFPPRIAGAVLLTAVACGLLLGRGGAIWIGAPVTALVAGLAYRGGSFVASPLLAWPAAALAIGLWAAAGVEGWRPRVGLAALPPALGTLGFVLGLVAVVFAGMSLDSGRCVAQLMLGGAAGFGFGTLIAVWMARRWGRVAA